MLDKSPPSLLNSGQFQIEARFYHHEEQARNPDTQL